MEDKVIQTERLTLIPISEDGLEAYHVVCSDHAASSWNLTGRRETLEDSANYFRRELRGLANGQRSYFVHLNTHLEPKECMGHVNLRPNRRVAQDDFVTWELGYSLRGEYWGKGYATEAVRAAVARLSEELHTRVDDDGKGGEGKKGKLVAWVGPANEPSLKVMAKVGFQVVKLLQFGGKEWWLGGAWRSDEVYVLERML